MTSQRGHIGPEVDDLPAWAQSLKNACEEYFVHGFVSEKSLLELVL